MRRHHILAAWLAPLLECIVVVGFGACAAQPDPPKSFQDPLVAAQPAAGDRVLSQTLTPRSGEVIDCHGGSILPATRASDNGGRGAQRVTFDLMRAAPERATS
jgi:hypothetical protein